MSRAFILNFNAPRSFEDILYFFETSKGSNLTLLMQDFEAGETSWSVPKYAMPGDTVLFMCAKSARANLGMAASHLPAHVSQNLLKFIGEQKKEYQRYSGSLIGCGVINTKPVYDADNKWWVSDIGQLFRFAESVRIDDFRSFITISSRGSVTALTDAQQEQLRWLICLRNPGAAIPGPLGAKPDLDGMHIDELRQKAEASVSAAIEVKGQTTVYHRNPFIAAYVKERAKGICQLCGKEAPFRTRDGKPFLECHHVKPLSEGGWDSPDNCVALCPNCHRKMHELDEEEDRRCLLAKAAGRENESISHSPGC